MRTHVLSYRRGTGWSAPLPEPADPARTMVLVFGGSAAYAADAEPLRQVHRALGNAGPVGCSTAGEILDQGIADDTLVVAVVEFADTRVRTAVARNGSEALSRAAGEDLARQLDHPDLAGVLVFSDGLHINGSELVRGVSAGLGPRVPVTGGLAADGERFEHTWVLVDGEPREGFVSAVGLYGSRVRFGHGSQGGWDFFGPERMITSAEGNVLYELDGKPALDLYKTYLGDLAEDLPASGLLFPLAVRRGPDDRHLVRTILAVDEDRKALVFAGDVPQGHHGQLMQANFDRLVGGAETAADQARPPHRSPVLAVAISCVGRRLVLGERTEEEVEATLHRLPPGSRQVGFYSYGEISPYTDGTCDLHNQTMTLTTIGEDT